MSVNIWDMTPDTQALIRAGAPVDSGRLADTAVALGDLLPAAARDA
jgi:3-phenylpropionate/trans-cinnamate dioxygenase ferredoxin reductase subunit